MKPRKISRWGWRTLWTIAFASLLVGGAAGGANAPSPGADAPQAPREPSENDKQFQELQKSNRQLASSFKKTQAAVTQTNLTLGKVVLNAQAATQASDKALRELNEKVENDRRATARANAARTRQLVYLLICMALVCVAAYGLIVWLRRRAQFALEVERAKQPKPPVPAGVLRSQRMNLQLPGAMLPNGGVVLGRNPKQATAVINRGDVSRRHARVYYESGSYWIEDLDSTFGTRINGHALKCGMPVVLTPGAIVAVGESEPHDEELKFTFEVGG